MIILSFLLFYIMIFHNIAPNYIMKLQKYNINTGIPL